MKKADYPKAAKELAERYAAALVEAYVLQVQQNLDYYEYPPNVDDFFAWVEGYGWELP